MLYYADGGPGPADRLVRIHAAKDGDYAAWRDAPAEIFSARDGWIPYPAQEKILMDGELFLIDDNAVPEIGIHIRDRSTQFA